MVASKVTVPFRAGSAGGRSVKDTDRQHPTETNPGFRHFPKIPQYTRKPEKPLPCLFAQILCKGMGIILIRSKTKPYGCFQKNLPLSSVFF